MNNLGEVLLKFEWLNEARLQEGLALQKKWGSPLGETLIGMGYLTPRKLYRSLAELWKMQYVDLRDYPIDVKLLKPELIHHYIQQGFIPLEKKSDDTVIIAVLAPSKEILELTQKEYGKVNLVLTSRYDLKWVHHTYFKEIAVHKAQEDLFSSKPHTSAKVIFTFKIKMFFLIAFGISAFLIFQMAWAGVMILNLTLHFFYFFTILYKNLISVLGASQIDQILALPEDKDCPTYSIFIPLYKEALSLPHIVQSMKNLDYPRSKLDIKFILEEDDKETLEAARALKLEHTFDVIIVPPSKLKTKPKALNYALPFARGEFLTIYDGEDLPERDQLKKAIAHFNHYGEEIGCFQARLNFFNADENLLTGCFALEYGHWFNLQLPGLSKLDWPIPLGGTSNHFRLHVLKDLLGWDPYNVTEDADLGLRMAVHGYQTKTLNSLTWEEAPVTFSVWLKQRTRWNKGYFVTFFIWCLRQPWTTFKAVGLRSFLSLFLFVGGPIFLNLFLPWVLGVFIWSLWNPHHYFLQAYDEYISLIGALNLMFGLIFAWIFPAIIMAKLKLKKLFLSWLFMPIYYLMQSVAAYRALFQLLFKPHLWEKTPHAESRYIKGLDPKLTGAYDPTHPHST